MQSKEKNKSRLLRYNFTVRKKVKIEVEVDRVNVRSNPTRAGLPIKINPTSDMKTKHSLLHITETQVVRIFQYTKHPENIL